MNTNLSGSIPQHSPDDLLTVDEVAAWLRVNRNTVYEQVRRQQIPALYVGCRGRTIRLKRSDVLLSLKSPYNRK